MAAGCAAQGPASFPTASKLPEDDRRPDGVAVDLTSEPPAWVDQADSGQGVVTLRAPLDRAVALAAVRTFFSSVVAEDINVMSSVVDPNALLQSTDLTAPAAYYNAVTSMWRQRFYEHEFGELGAALIYREADVISYGGTELDRLPLGVRYLQPIPPPQPTDLVLQVPIITHSIKTERLLGVEMYFWLRREGDRYIIYRMAEDMPL
jgi:hypothetical protein